MFSVIVVQKDIERHSYQPGSGKYCFILGEFGQPCNCILGFEQKNIEQYKAHKSYTGNDNSCRFILCIYEGYSNNNRKYDGKSIEYESVCG